MLIGIDPILGPDCLALLRAMGHGDEVVLADANFPAVSVGRRVARVDGVAVDRLLDAVLGVLPVDEFEPAPFVGMRAVGDAEPRPAVLEAMERVIARRTGRRGEIALIERHAFYERARAAFAVIVTGERRLYGNLIVRKGIIPPDPAGPEAGR